MKDGEPVLVIMEAKAWASNKVKPAHLSAFGFSTETKTLEQNKKVLFDEIIRTTVKDSDVQKKLLANLKVNNFEVHLYGIQDRGQFKTGWDTAAIEKRFYDLNPNITVVIGNIPAPRF